MSGPRNSRGQTAHYTDESADMAEPTDARSADIHDTEARLLAMFAESTSPEDHALLTEAIQHCVDLRHSMSDVSDHTRDAEQVLAAFEQREGMRSPAAYGQPDNANTVMELKSDSSQVFRPWGAGGPPIAADEPMQLDMHQHTTDPTVLAASDALAAPQQASADLVGPFGPASQRVPVGLVDWAAPVQADQQVAEQLAQSCDPVVAHTFRAALHATDGIPDTTAIDADDGASAPTADSPRSTRSDEAAAQSAFDTMATAESWQHELDAGRALPCIDAMALRAAFTPLSRPNHYVPVHICRPDGSDVRDEPTRHPGMLTAWYAGECTYTLQAAAADQHRSEQYLNALHAEARFDRHEQWGMDGDTPAGRDLAKDAHDDRHMHASACAGQVRFVERNGHPVADPITPFLETGHYSAVMLAAHTKNMQAEYDIHCAELRRIRKLKLNLVDCLLGPTDNRIARARDDIMAELM